jgi:hypothetical protein
MAFGSEVMLLLGAGFVVLGPKRMQTMRRQIGRTKAQFDKASRSFFADVAGVLDETPGPITGGDDNHKDPDTELVLPDELIERIMNYRRVDR